MGRRNRQRKKREQGEKREPGEKRGQGETGEKLAAPTTDYADAEGNVLRLRGSLSPASRREYAETLAGGLEREDAWQRAVEFLFERLAVGWTIAGIETTKQKELLARFRVATPDERRFIRDTIRGHVSDHFPELQAP